MHFDHERIPERVVHARGAAAHGVFEPTAPPPSLTSASFLAKKGRRRRSSSASPPLLGSRGSADTVRDVRGFAAKFYTAEGNFDLVGNNMPVFFIQDGIKFPDLIHAGEAAAGPRDPAGPDRARHLLGFRLAAHRGAHHVMWAMSDRGIPRSYRTMEGFGVHTFRLVNAAGETHAGEVPLEAGRRCALPGLGGSADRRPAPTPTSTAETSPTRSRAGAFPEWELGIQVFPDTEDETFEGIDLLDATKMVPEELAPVQTVGTLTLTATRRTTSPKPSRSPSTPAIWSGASTSPTTR